MITKEGRSLAHIERVRNIRPIQDADRIEQINVLGWNLVTKKGEFKEGDLCVYIEIDSRVPSDMECFSFLSDRNYKVKTIKLKKVVSQGLALPISILPNSSYKEGQDVTDILKIKKIQEDYVPKETNKEILLKQKHKKLYKNKIFKILMKFKYFRILAFKLLLPKKNKNEWPSWVVKTNEERIQNMPWILENKSKFIATEKIDGTSSTYTLKRIKKNKYKFIVCSRNVVQSAPDKKCFYEKNVYWDIAKKYNIEKVLEDLIGDNEWITLQGETIGEEIQKNKYNIKGLDFYAFNLITQKQGKINSLDAEKILRDQGIKFVPIIDANFILPDTIEDLMKYSTGKSKLYNTLREGIVFRNYDQNISFKCVSNDFLIKWGL